MPSRLSWGRPVLGGIGMGVGNIKRENRSLG